MLIERTFIWQFDTHSASKLLCCIPSRRDDLHDSDDLSSAIH